MEFFKSPLDDYLLDVLWEKYWINTLSESTLKTHWNHLNAKVQDVAGKIQLNCKNMNSMMDYRDKDRVKERKNLVKERFFV